MQTYLFGFSFYFQGQYNPSYLLCPETYIFQSIEKCLPKLDISKYHRLEENPDKGKYILKNKLLKAFS